MVYEGDLSENKSELTEHCKQLFEFFHQRKYLCKLRQISDKAFWLAYLSSPKIA